MKSTKCVFIWECLPDQWWYSTGRKDPFSTSELTTESLTCKQFWVLVHHSDIEFLARTKCEHVPHKTPNGFALYLEIVISSIWTCSPLGNHFNYIMRIRKPSIDMIIKTETLAPISKLMFWIFFSIPPNGTKCIKFRMDTHGTWKSRKLNRTKTKFPY